MPPIKPGTANGQERRSHDNAQRVRTDQVADLWFRNPQIRGNAGHQPHDGKLSRTYPKPAHGE